jgi:hypothetical protein
MLIGATVCDGPICTVVTLGHHPAVLLGFAAMCVAGLAVLVPFTRGLAQCNSREVVGLAIAATAGGVARLGIAALLIGAAIVLIVFATLVLASTATSRRETNDAQPRTPFPIAPAKGVSPSRTHRAERPDQGQVAEPPRSTPIGVDRESPGFY